MDLLPLLKSAFEFRQEMLQSETSLTALRLFNGFWEGWPQLAVDLYDHTLLINGYAQNHEENLATAELVQDFYRSALPLKSVLLKSRSAPSQDLRRGFLLSGDFLPPQVTEYRVQYALDLRLHQDASLYLDTRLLRRWAIDHLSQAKVLNTFAYTGSLGAAALAGGASQVLQTDLSSKFLSLARSTYRLNGWQPHNPDLIVGDFFTVVARLKRQGKLFDCIFLDPPFFSNTAKGRVDLNLEFSRLINKVRPLAGDGSRLVAVNNAVFVSGSAYMESLEGLSQSGHIEIEQLIPAPPDFTGFNNQPLQPLPADPSPFNYSTKIAILRLRRKDGKTAS